MPEPRTIQAGQPLPSASLDPPAVVVAWAQGALPRVAPLPAAGGGAVLAFEGVVRSNENGQPLLALDYETYPPMTDRLFQELAGEVAERYGLLVLDAQHSTGRVPVGSASFRLRVAAAHRREAIDAVDTFIHRMKAEVPIWKVPVYADPGVEKA